MKTLKNSFPLFLPIAYLLSIILLTSAGPDGSGGACIIKQSVPKQLLIASTSNPELDQAIKDERDNLEQIFKVKPSFSLLNDQKQPNAYAYVSGHPDHRGEVYFGVALMGAELEAWDKGPEAVAGILAHEYAHILQGIKQTRMNGKVRELHADYLAGWYLGKKDRVISVEISQFAKSVYEKGDFHFWSRNHHGTPEQRQKSMIAGFRNAQLDLGQAYREGQRFVINL